MTTARYVQLFDPVVEHTKRFTEFIRSLPSDAAMRPVPGLDWSAADVGAHVLSVYRRYTVDPRRAPTLAALAQQNADDVAAIGMNLPAIADEIDQQLETIASVAPQFDPEQRFEFHAGAEVTANAAWANLIAELLVHGDDITRATGIAFTMPERDVEGIWRALLPAATGWLRPEALSIDERYEFRFNFGVVDVHLRGGDVVVDDEPTETADHVITSTDAIDTTLAVPYRRRLVRDPTLALFASRFYDI